MKTIHKVASSAHGAVDRLAGAADQAANSLGDGGRQLKKAEQRLVEDSREYTRDNPVKSFAIALAAGFVLGRLSSRCQTVNEPKRCVSDAASI
jgi:ElaB/YqjD/DUF883 family membrane-anchored ribosome-binding protein